MIGQLYYSISSSSECKNYSDFVYNCKILTYLVKVNVTMFRGDHYESKKKTGSVGYKISKQETFSSLHWIHKLMMFFSISFR